MNDKNKNIMGGVILRHPQTDFREVDEDVFLVHPDGVSIYNLNPTAAAIWRLMGRSADEPMSGDEMAEIMSAAFVAIPPARIKADVENVLTGLLNEGFAVKE
ncbi:MAG: PqqD family protein [Rhodospirillaceae bacterium]|nr:PqqD family protein [Rhodospirillaceae bacterium]